MSNMPDVTGTEEGVGKGKVPKRVTSCNVLLWA